MQIVATLIFALAAPPLLAVLGRRTLGDHPSITGQLLFQLGLWAIVAIVVFTVARIERRPLSSIGLRRPRWSTIVTGLGFGLIIRVLLPPISTWLVRQFGLPGYEDAIIQLRELPAWALIFMGITAGIVEETLYRGYAIERLALLTGRYWVAGAIAALAFGLAHIPEWGSYAIVDLIFGIAATAFYLWRRDLLANIIAHATLLTVALLQLPSRT